MSGVSCSAIPRGPDGAELFHGGRSIGIDTNACGNPHMPDDARRLVTLLELRDDIPFAEARRVVIDTRDAPDRSRTQRPGTGDGHAVEPARCRLEAPSPMLTTAPPGARRPL